MMAKCNCKNKCGCYGALDAVYREHECFYNRPMAESDCETCVTCAGYPLYYNGACPGTENCGCGGCCPQSCRACHCASQFVAVPPVIVAAGGRLPMRPGGDNCHCHCHCRCRGDKCGCRERGGRIYLPKEGTYIAAYTFLVPPGTQINTQLALALDDERIFASETAVITGSENGTHFFGGQAVFEAESGAHLALETTSAIEIPSENYAYPIATLILQKIN